MTADGNANGARRLFRHLLRPLDGRAWPTVAGLVLATAIGLGTYHLWHEHGHRLTKQPRYQLDPHRLKVTAQPEHIRSDVMESAILHGGLGAASLLDKDVTLLVRQAFAVQPWVREVLMVDKVYPSTIKVELRYRRPVAMVEIPAGTIPGFDYEGLLPIDEDAYLLPSETTQEEANRFPKVAGVDSHPAGPPGSSWGDTRVAEAIEIILLLEKSWDALGLLKVQVPQRGGIGEPASSRFELVTRGRNRFTWGSAPGSEKAGEEPAKQKAAGLEAFTQQFGTLDEWYESQHAAEASVGAVIETLKR